MEEALIAILLADDDLAALVGSKIHWLRRPQKQALPSVTLQTIGGPRTNHTEGADSIVGYRVQVDCWASTFAGAKACARAVEAAVSGKRFPAQATNIHGVFVLDANDSFEGEEPEAIHRSRLDLRVWHRT